MTRMYRGDEVGTYLFAICAVPLFILALVAILIWKLS